MLLSTQDLLTMLGVRNASPERVARYDLLRRSVEIAVKQHLNWDVEGVVGQVDYYDGNVYVDIPLRQPFVTSVTDVRLDFTGAYGSGPDAFAASTALVNGQDYALKLEGALGKSGLLRRLPAANPYWFPSDAFFRGNQQGLSYNRGPYWPGGIGNIKVTCNFGFPTGLVVSGVVWASGVATFTTTLAHGLVAGMDLNVSFVDPEGYNGDFRVLAAPTATTFTVRIATNPGAYVSGGAVDAIPRDIKLAVATAVSTIQNSVRYGFPVQSESLADYSYSLAISRDVEFGTVKQLLAHYRDMPL